ncbi:T9SS type A sorting domain-containing protein [uncultured Dokdonia sp.]|uniref:T9SS type A sorting domain-containing protein n=1 Tax=uncultured Dokdonia sp. TaxID=575653 RepID=UPI002610A156|nr:T9SS type A sorting domain-containing protein [uncultured Dokdonia sp.]
MKNFRWFLGILPFLISQSILAQDPLLFEGEWVLYSLEINGEQFVPESNNEVEFIKLLFEESTNDNPDTPYSILGTVCDSFFSSVIFEESDFSTFMLGDDYVTTLANCDTSENQNFQNRYFSFYETSISDPFEYSIVFLGNNATLHVIASNGDIADYGNTVLSTSDFVKPSFSVYPNPAQDQLFIETHQISEAYTITVFDVNGKQKVQTSKKTLEANPLQIQHWASGIYFVQLKSQDRIVSTKRFIKK